MPYMKVKKGEEICIYKKGGEGKPVGESLGCHKTEAEANKQLAALYANTKTLKTIETTPDTMRLRGYVAVWGDEDVRDLEGIGSHTKNADGSLGQYFVPETEFESDFTATGQLLVDWEHGADPEKIGNSPEVVLGYVDWKTAQKDEDGLIVERVLNRRHRYMKWLEKLIDAGMLGSSSKATHDAEIKPNGMISKWPLQRDTLSVMPMEPRLMDKGVLEAMKALKLIPDEPESDSGSEEPVSQPAAGQKPKGTAGNSNPTKGVMTMLTEQQKAILKAMFPDIPEDKLETMAGVLSLGNTPPVAPPAAPVTSGVTSEQIKTIVSETVKALQPEKPPAPEADPARPPFDFKPTTDPEKDAVEKAVNAAYMLRFGDEKEMEKTVYEDVIGRNYRQLILEQNRAFAKSLRWGDKRLSLEEQKSLQHQIYPLDYVLQLVRDGMSTAEVKTIMIESQGDLGGDAVPPNIQSQIITRLPGLTCVRGGGATTITLASGNSIEVPIYTGVDTAQRYVGALRGSWGNETKTPEAKNATLGLVPLMADLYTYKVQMSQTLVEDAANLVSLVIQDIAWTMAIDEDEAFLIGNGTGKPRGILPGATNTDSLTEVTSGSGSSISILSPKKLKRGIATQYRLGAAYYGASDTFGAVEQLQDANNLFVYPDLSETDKLLNRATYESEALAAIAAGAYPMIFCNMSGYWIVERLGFTIQRFQDSNTGPNIVEYHVRRRIGGRVAKPWQFAVLKISA